MKLMIKLIKITAKNKEKYDNYYSYGNYRNAKNGGMYCTRRRGHAKKLETYTHPERAFYIFGPEDGSLKDDILSRCKDKIYISTKFCLNLAMAVGTILYDRQRQRKAYI
jgi:tRNA(Leu) C34 or U34 (ribose-2'-O)-methylase TrmL